MGISIGKKKKCALVLNEECVGLKSEVIGIRKFIHLLDNIISSNKVLAKKAQRSGDFESQGLFIKRNNELRVKRDEMFQFKFEAEGQYRKAFEKLFMKEYRNGKVSP